MAADVPYCQRPAAGQSSGFNWLSSLDFGRRFRHGDAAIGRGQWWQRLRLRRTHVQRQDIADRSAEVLFSQCIVASRQYAAIERVRIAPIHTMWKS